MARNPDYPDDRTLIRRIVEDHDRAAFDILVTKHYSRAYQIAYSVLFNREDSEEVTQDAFMRINRALSFFRGDSEFTTWLYRIVMNLAKNKFRWNKIRGVRSNVSIDAPVDNAKGDGELFIDLPDDTPTPAEQLAFDELKQDTSKAMAALPKTYREAVILRNMKDLSYEEIAAMLGCKVGTVKSRIARGREQLRDALKLGDS